MEKIKIFYRLSDHGYNKVKPDYIDNKNCLENFLSVFGKDDITIIADNVNEETYQWLEDTNLKVERTNFGSGAQSFNHIFKKVLDFNRNYVVYLVENDYLHLKGLFATIDLAFS